MRAVHLAAAGANLDWRDGVDATAAAAPADAASARLIFRSRCPAVFVALLFCAVCAARPAHRRALTLQQAVVGRAVSNACASRTQQAMLQWQGPQGSHIAEQRAVRIKRAPAWSATSVRQEFA